MTTDIMLALALVAALVLNAMQASKAAEWRRIMKDLRYQIDLLTRPIEDEEAVYLRPSGATVYTDRDQTKEEHADWLADHPGVTPKPGYERKRR